MRRLNLILIVLITAFFVAAPAHAAWGPGDGDLWFDGYYFADSYMRWLNLNGVYNDGWFPDPDPNFEMDIVMNQWFNKSCTSWTDLPAGYDDCPTAGVSEPSTAWSFGIGTYHLKRVIVNGWYYASWRFRNTRSVNTSLAGLNIQQGGNFCTGKPETIWCQGALQTYRIFSFTAIHGVSFYKSWYHPEW
jgi:hypothetical protein